MDSGDSGTCHFTPVSEDFYFIPCPYADFDYIPEEEEKPFTPYQRPVKNYALKPWQRQSYYGKR